LRKVEHVDHLGRRFLVWLPDGVPDSEAPKGILIGPQTLDGLGLPLEFEVSLHNQLFQREVWNHEIAERDPVKVVQAVRSAAKVSAHSVIEHWRTAILAEEDIEP
jgi:hypothetical protein